MSGFKPVGVEALYASYQAATTSTPTVSPGSSMIVGYDAIEVPAKYFDKLGTWTSSLKFKMGALMTTTATIPTWRFVLYGVIHSTSPGAFGAGGITIADSGTFTPTAALANTFLEIELEIGLRALALGAGSTLVGWGKAVGPNLNAAGMIPIPAAGAYTPPATYDSTQTYDLWPGLILGAATAGNTVTTQYAKLYGEN